MPRFCTRCGADLTEQDQFCARCGCAQRGSAQPALVSGSAQVAVLPPTNAQPPQRIDREKQAAPPAPPTPAPHAAPQPASSGRTPLMPMVMVAVRTLGFAVGLELYCEFVSMLQDTNNNLFLNHWSPLDTPRQLRDNANHAGGLGLVWGLLLGSVGSVLKLKRDARKERQ